MLRSVPLTVLLLASLLLASAFSQAPAAREWTSADGKKISAIFMGMDAAGVKLKLATGATVTVPLTRLSPADQEFAAAQAKLTPAAAETTWPRSVALEEKPEVEVVREDAEKKEFVYRSPHYEFVCDSRLGGNVVREFGRLFEATYLLNCKLPLNLQPKPEPLRSIFLARLFTDKEDYMKAGGIQGSAGVYRSGEKALMVPLSSLGVKMVGSRVSLENSNDDDNATLIHEITHQMMNHWLPSLRTWLTEGSAEYVEMLEYNRNGRFSMAGLSRQMQKYAERMNYWRPGSFEMLDLEELMNIQGGAWAAALSRPVSMPGITGGTQATQNYGSAGLLTYYFYHLHDKGDGKHMIDFLKAVQEHREGSAEEEAAIKQHLMRDRSYAQLAEEVKKAFRKEGIDITYSAPGKNGMVSSQQ